MTVFYFGNNGTREIINQCSNILIKDLGLEEYRTRGRFKIGYISYAPSNKYLKYDRSLTNEQIQTVKDKMDVSIIIFKDTMNMVEYEMEKERRAHNKYYEGKKSIDITTIGDFGKILKPWKNNNHLWYLKYPGNDFQRIFRGDLNACQCPLPELFRLYNDPDKYYRGSSNYGDIVGDAFAYAFCWPFILVTFIPGTIVGVVVGPIHWGISKSIHTVYINKYFKQLDWSMKELYEYCVNEFDNGITISDVLMRVNSICYRPNESIENYVKTHFGSDHLRLEDLIKMVKGFIFDNFCEREFSTSILDKIFLKMGENKHPRDHKEIVLMGLGYILSEHKNRMSKFWMIRSYVEPNTLYDPSKL